MGDLGELNSGGCSCLTGPLQRLGSPSSRDMVPLGKTLARSPSGIGVSQVQTARPALQTSGGLPAPKGEKPHCLLS